VDFEDGKLSIEAQINSEKFKPKLASGRDYVKMFSGIYESIHRLIENKDLESEKFKELEINFNNVTQSCYTIETTEISEKPLQRKNKVKRDYLSPKSDYNKSKNIQEHLINNMGKYKEK
jgi:hypothetical protein